MLTIPGYRKAFLEYMEEKFVLGEPTNLYEPVHYILHLGGKRLRPVMVLMAAELFGASFKKALDAALAIEVFHNFSLIHDDIMDAAPLRRGAATVHEKWDLNTGILSGDVMLINAYELLESYNAETYKKLSRLFSKTAREVCEGQQYDIDFESREDVEIEEYLRMIEYKTAVLLGAALQMGAIIAGASEESGRQIYQFGRLLGIAFQLQDDYLDCFGDPETFGKQIGGDILENKKTFLYITALEKAERSQALQLEHLYSLNPADGQAKIDAVKGIFEQSGAARLAREEIKKYTNQAFEVLEQIPLSEEKKELLQKFGSSLMVRNV